MTEGLSIWTIYDSPPEFPGQFVAVLWVATEPTNVAMVSANLEALRARLAGQGFVKLSRSLDDDPKIVEVWL